MKIKKRIRRIITIIVFLIIIAVGIVKMSKMYYNSIEVAKLNERTESVLKSDLDIIGKQVSVILNQNASLSVNELSDPNIIENKSIIDINSNFMEMKCTTIYYVKDDLITRTKHILTDKSRYEVLNAFKYSFGTTYTMDVENEELANSFTWKNDKTTIKFKDNIENMIISIEKN